MLALKARFKRPWVKNKQLTSNNWLVLIWRINKKHNGKIIFVNNVNLRKYNVVQRYKYQYIYKKFIYNLYHSKDKYENIYYDFKII